MFIHLYKMNIFEQHVQEKAVFYIHVQIMEIFD